MNSYQQDAIRDTHSKVIGYLLWIFGFTGAHRFYYGKPVTGTIWFFTFGLLGIGWLIDLFLIPAMDREADLRFTPGPIEYSVAWILLTFLGVLGVHRMYQGKWLSGIIYLLTGGVFFLGVLYDFWTLNDQVSIRNAQKRGLFSKTESSASRAGSLPHWIEVFTHHVFTEDPSVGASLLARGATRYQAW